MNCFERYQNSRRSNSVKDLTEALPTSREFSKQLKNQVKIIKKDPYKVYTLIEKIGKGATGNVYKAQNCQSGEIVALKQIELSRQFSKEKILNEIGMMMISSHPNILECFCAFEYQQSIYMSLELMDQTVFELLNTSELSEGQIAYILKEVLKGVEYLHSHHRLHRDLKSDNILFNSKGEVKISDFGFSTQITSDAVLKNSLIGTPSWMAPEIAAGEGYSNKVDIWAVGILLFEMTQKKLPFRAGSSMEILCLARNSPSPQISGNWTKELKEFAELCFFKAPEERASASELLDHQFLRKASLEQFLKALER